MLVDLLAHALHPLLGLGGAALSFLGTFLGCSGAGLLVPEGGFELAHLVENARLELPQFLHAGVVVLGCLLKGKRRG